MIGQGYVGARSMSVKEKDIQAVVRESCLQAVCVHCSVHVLNIVFIKSCAIQSNLGIRTQFVLKGCSKTDLFENRIIFFH